MPDKVGRNAPCPCGSGRKHKQCCLKNAGQRRAKKHDLRPFFPGEPPAPIVFQGSPVVAIRNTLVYTDPGRTFHELLLSIAATTLGERWTAEAIAKPADRHPIAQWFIDCRKIRDPSRGKHIRDNIYESEMNGGTLRLILLGRDLWYLRHAAALPSRVLHCLRDPHLFQGALYEIAVASIMARVGYSLDWYEGESMSHRPEFVASRDGDVVVVEAKSRHRPGALGQDERSVPSGSILDLERLFREAVRKDPEGRPYLIFLDCNLPIEATPANAQQLAKDFDSLTTRMAKMNKTGSGFNAAFATNYSFHYEVDGKPIRGWNIVRNGPMPSVPFSGDRLRTIHAVVQDYSRVPLEPPV